MQNILTTCAFGVLCIVLFYPQAMICRRSTINHVDHNNVTVTCQNNRTQQKFNCLSNQTCCGKFSENCCDKIPGKSWKKYLLTAVGMVGTLLLLCISCLICRCCRKHHQTPIESTVINPLVSKGPNVCLPSPSMSKLPKGAFNYTAPSTPQRPPSPHASTKKKSQTEYEGGPLYMNLVEPPPDPPLISEL